MTEQTTKTTETWEQPAIIRMAAADAENANAPTGEGNSNMGMAS
ncbi:hypothetical protein [Novosphingobium cyanobacteriorum]|uniref:Uncharacterized protein n=1 Tax=Novosphingobium cyanobacteriorum TaxID=3024215 RepID=A0ABT6CEW7_9SPHN|nr:hypothetical protein [Novosphingobium cyanobacteriorum]MDF8332454.1 hypothetical protein [Novosphingobium cyanobacteriorum]